MIIHQSRKHLFVCTDAERSASPKAGRIIARRTMDWIRPFRRAERDEDQPTDLHGEKPMGPPLITIQPPTGSLDLLLMHPHPWILAPLFPSPRRSPAGCCFSKHASLSRSSSRVKVLIAYAQVVCRQVRTVCTEYGCNEATATVRSAL